MADGYAADGKLAYPVAAVALHQIGTETAEQEDAQTIGTHHNTNLPRAIAFLRHKIRYAKDEHIDTRHQQQVGKAEPPEVTMPQIHVYGCILCIHNQFKTKCTMYIIYQDRGGLIALLYTWIFCALNSIDVSLHALLHLLAYLGEVAQELRLEALGHSQRISIN